MGNLLFPKSVIDKLSSAEASVDGAHITVRFPLGQLIGIGIIAASVVFSVWLSTRDLSANVGLQTVAIGKLDKSVVKLSDTMHIIDKRSLLNEDRIKRIGPKGSAK